MHSSYYVSGSGKLIEVPKADFDGDPLGLVLMWEQPLPGYEYFIGVFPSVGIVNWSRDSRNQDEESNNGVVEVIRKGRGKQPDVQVAEFAAPIHGEDLADVVNLLGRLYGLNEEEGQALCAIEVYPAPGLPLQNKLIHFHGYLNLPAWVYQDSIIPKMAGGSIGWFSTPKSLRDLWSKCARLMAKRQVVINSAWLVKELGTCVLGRDLYAVAAGLNRDDRVKAFNLALWYAHRWVIDGESEPTRDMGPGEKPVDFQCAGMSDSEYEEALTARWEELMTE